jgi:ABC-type transport system substrate-binding protein
MRIAVHRRVTSQAVPPVKVKRGRRGTFAACAVGTAVLAMTLATAVRTSAAPLSSNANSTMVIAVPVGPDALDPIASTNYNFDAMVWSTVYDTLVSTTVSGDIVPRLATKWTASPTAKTYTFFLRHGVRFQNGDSLTARDVVYSLNRAMGKGVPMVKQRFTNIAKITAKGSFVVTVNLKTPDFEFLHTIGDPTGLGVVILDHKYGGNLATHPMGSGPYRFVSWAPNSQLVLERNDAFWNKSELPKYKTLKVRVIPQDASQVAALNSGDVSVIQPTEIATVNTLRKNKSMSVVGYPNGAFWITISRIGNTAPDGVAKAIALSIDRPALAKTTYLGEAKPGSTASPFLSYALPISKLPNYHQDIAKAKQLLAAAGFPNGIDLSLTWPSRPPYKTSFFEVLQSSLAQAGIRVTLQPLDEQAWEGKLLNAKYDISAVDEVWFANPLRYVLPRTGWQAPPETIVPSLPALLTQFSAAPTKTQRAAVFQKIQKLEAETAYPFLGTVWVDQSVVYPTKRLAHAPKVTSLLTGDQRGFFESLVPR